LGAAAFFQEPYNAEDLLAAIQLALTGSLVAAKEEVYAI
jgi:hypothetical protein